MLADKEEFKIQFVDKLKTLQGKTLEEATPLDEYQALSALVRDLILKKWVDTNSVYKVDDEKQVYYFSIEFLIGRLLGSNMLNLGILDAWQEGLDELGVDLTKLEEQEADAGLGNGGLGRLAACFLDSLASLKLPGHGNGIRYKYGLFEQKMVNGAQVESPDNWLKNGYMWELRKADKAVEVHFNGRIEVDESADEPKFTHKDYDTVLAVPYDIPVIGYKNDTVNTLRLWSAETADTAFNKGDYKKAMEYRYAVEAISEILYPEDSSYEGRVLRLKQQYFFVSAGLQSIVRRFKKHHRTIMNLADHVAIHINDTHPALCVPELMRILMDEEGLNWDEAWHITTNTISYTNHTIMPEALEKWPIEIFQGLLPRMYMIVNEINERFCRELWNHYPGDWDKIHYMAVIADGFVRMANLSVVGSYSVNGVAEIHTEILKKDVMRDFYLHYPYKFNNKTNGITHRRWLIKSNPKLSKLISETIGDSWIHHPTDLRRLAQFAEVPLFQEKFREIKRQNKIRLANYIEKVNGITLDVDSIFDIQVKRIHAYKRQSLNILHVMDLYNRLLANPDMDITPHTYIFAGKAAPGYYLAKQTIKLINTVAQVINNDPRVNDKLKVVFIGNYSVSLGEMIFAAADVSEQISTASKEASGTGNMKFMMNGAVTCGTLDGANIEIYEEVGDDNIVIFGLTADEVLAYYANGSYRPLEIYENDSGIKLVLDQLTNGFLPVGPDEFRAIQDGIMHGDEYFVLRDFAAYREAQQKISDRFRDKALWARMGINNIAFSGKFSSDRTINEYAIGIWRVQPVY
ncbi:MAG: glycogen/starch/alpha-glucan phosphorylase [Sporomusaceae bacterium]|nr:glycogen/starch/alpha-glucan phosphorylase [Sporomusaceae bacterium]